MKDKYKNIWKRSELRDLVKNILIYGDKWDLISEKTGSRKEQKYKKHAKRFFIKNSFILHRIYENANSTTIDTFFEFKNKILILNFSTIKLKFKDFKPEKLNIIKRNFYKNLKSLEIESSYFDDYYIQNNFNENNDNDEIYEINQQNQSIAFTTNNNYTENLQSNFIDENFNITKDSLSESEKEKNYSHSPQRNQSNPGLNRNYFSSNAAQSNNFLSGFNNISSNFPETRNCFGNFNTNSLANFGFQGFNGFGNENLPNNSSSQNKDPNFLNNINNNYNNNLSFNNYFYEEKYENNENEKDSGMNQITENVNDNNNNTFAFDGNLNNANSFNMNYPSNINNTNSFLFNNFTNAPNNNFETVNFQSRTHENSMYNEGERSEFNNFNNKATNELNTKKGMDKDYNLISLRIIKRFNSLNSKNSLNLNNSITNKNNESLEQDLISIKPFYIEKVHKEIGCKHNPGSKKLANRRRKRRQTVNKAIEKSGKNNNNVEEENNNNNNNYINNFDHSFLKDEDNKDLDNFFQEENEEDFFNRQEIANEFNKEDTNFVKEFKKEALNSDKNTNYDDNQFKNLIKNNEIKASCNVEDKKEEYVFLALDNISRKNSDIFRLDKVYSKKKLSANSIITQITQNNPNYDTNGEVSPNKKTFFYKETPSNLNLNKDEEPNPSLIMTKNVSNTSTIQNLDLSQNIDQTQALIAFNAVSEFNNQTEDFVAKSAVNHNNPLQTAESVKGENNLSNCNNKANSGLFVQKKRQRPAGARRDSPLASRKKSYLRKKPGSKFSHNCEAADKRLPNCESRFCASSESFNDSNIFEVKNKSKNIFNNQNQFERELNSEFNFNKLKYEDKIGIDETLSSNHSAIEDSKRVITTKIFEDEANNKNGFVAISNNRSLNAQEVKNDMLDFEKNYQLFNENNNNNNNKNNNFHSSLFVSFNSIQGKTNDAHGNNINADEKNIQSNFLEKLSVLSDKGKSHVNSGNSAAAALNYPNFYPAINNNNNNNFGFNNSFNNLNTLNFNNNGNNNNFNNFGASGINNNLDLNFNLLNSHQNINNNNNINFNVGNKFLQSTNLNDIYFNFNNKITAGLNGDNHAMKKSASRKNSTVIKSEALSSNQLNNNAIINLSSNENAMKKPGRKNDSFRITKNYNEEGSKLKLKESFSNPQLLNPADEVQLSFSPMKTNNKGIFLIQKFSKEEKEIQKLKDEELLKQQQEYEALNENEQTENDEGTYFSYNTEYLEKGNFNNSTIKALVSLRKITFKKNSVDLTCNINNSNLIFNANSSNPIRNSANEKSPLANKNEGNSDLNENCFNPENNCINNCNNVNNENDMEKNVMLSNLNYSGNGKEKKKLGYSDGIFNANIKECKDESLSVQGNLVKGNSEFSNLNSVYNNNNNLKNYESLNALRKDSSLGAEPIRKNSFIITKEIRRKDNNFTNNPEKKISIDEAGLSFLRKNQIENTLLQPLRVNKKKQIFMGHNQPEAIDECEYKNLKPTNSFTNNNDSSNTSLIQEKATFNKQNFITFKDKSANHGLITSELDIDTIKSLRPNIDKSNPKKINSNTNKLNKINSNSNNQNLLNTNMNTNESNKDSQIFTNFNSYIFNIDLLNKNNNNPNNSVNQTICGGNNLNLFKPEIYSNIIDLNCGNEIAHNFSKDKNSHFSYDNNLTKECLMFSELNDELEYCMNSSDSDVSQKKQKILDDKVEKLISSVIQKQKKNNFVNKNTPNLNTKISLNSGFNNIATNNFANLNSNNLSNNSSINNSNNINNVNNAFHQNEIKFNVNNFTHLHSNKLYNKEKTDPNSFNILNNLEALNPQVTNLNSTAAINSSNFYSGPPSITTNNINNFHIINSNGPCIFPITHNITNYGNIMNHTIAPQAPIIKGDYKIQNQNFNIINEEGMNSEVNFGVYGVENNHLDNRKKSLKYSDAELIESTVFNSTRNPNKHLDNSLKQHNKSGKNEKFIINSAGGFKEKGVVGNLINNNYSNLNAKEKNNVNILKNNNNINNTNSNPANKNNSMNHNGINSAKDNCLTKIGNFSDFNLGNFNDGPITNRNTNSGNIHSNYNFNNNLMASYESLRVFEDKSNFINDKRIQINQYKPNNNVYGSCNNYLMNNSTLISNTNHYNGFNPFGDNQAISFNNPNHCKEEFNFSDPFDLNFHIDNKIEDQAIANSNKLENNNDDVFDMLGFN